MQFGPCVALGDGSSSSCGLDPGDINFAHFHHRLEGPLRFLAICGQSFGEHARRDLLGDALAVAAPTAGALLPAIVDDRIRVSVGLLLIVGSDLKRECLVVSEGRASVQSEARDTADRELHFEHIARLARWEVARRMLDGADVAVGKVGGVKARRGLGFLVIPDLDRVLRHDHGLPSQDAV